MRYRFSFVLKAISVEQKCLSVYSNNQFWLDCNFSAIGALDAPVLFHIGRRLLPTWFYRDAFLLAVKEISSHLLTSFPELPVGLHVASVSLSTHQTLG